MYDINDIKNIHKEIIAYSKECEASDAFNEGIATAAEVIEGMFPEIDFRED